MRKRPLLLLFLTAWLCGWTHAGFTAAAETFADASEPGGAWAATALWLCLWLVGETLVLATIAALLFGRERSELSPSALVVRFQVFGIGFTRQVDPARVTLLRVDVAPTWGEDSPGLLEMGTTVALGCGDETIRFGRGLDEAEAEIFVQELLATGAFPNAAR